MRQELEANGQARIDRWIPLGMSVMTAPEPLRSHDLRFYVLRIVVYIWTRG